MAATAKIIDFLLVGYRDPTTDLPLNGGTVEVYEAGTSNTAYVWDDRAKTLPTSTGRSTVTLDSAGKAEVYGDDIYKFIIKASSGATIETIDQAEYFSQGVLTGTLYSVASLSALQAITSQANGDKAVTTYRSTIGDGGGGGFYWNSADLSGTLVLATVASTSVDAGTETVTSAGHGLSTGDAVVSGTAVNGLSTNTIYYVIKSDANNYKLANSYSLAFAGTARDLTGTTNFTVSKLLDPQQGFYVIKSGNSLTGTSGAWIRQPGGALKAEWFGLRSDSADNGAALNGMFSVSGWAVAPAGTYNIQSEVSWPSNLHFTGAGEGKTIFNFNLSANPASSSFMFAARSKSKLYIDDMTFTSNAESDSSLFDVGTYSSGDNTYTGSLSGNINGVLISSCTDVKFGPGVEVKYFNYHGIRVSVENTTDYNQRLDFEGIYGHNCRVAPISILGTKTYWIHDGVFTDNGLFDATFIDGATGYGIVGGRTPSATQLRSADGWIYNNFTARNARHGIDVHAGADIRVFNNTSEDDLLNGIAIQDLSGSFDDALTGSFWVENNSLRHTSWVESRYALVTNASAGVERQDSCPILVSAAGVSLLQNAYVRNNKIESWRYRQLVANVAGTDLVGPIIVSAVTTAEVFGNHVDATVSSYFPSQFLDVSGARAIIKNNTFRGSQRSTVSKPAVRWASTTFDAEIDGNTFELVGVFSDTGGTQAAYPFFEKVTGGDSPVFRGNDITETTQGTRGSLIKTTTTNAQLGYNGYWGLNSGNTLNGNPYSSEIDGNFSIFLSAAGSGRFDGSDASNAMLVNNATTFDVIAAMLPKTRGTLTINIADDIDLGSGVPSSIAALPFALSQKVVWSGENTDNTLATTKTAKLRTTGAWNFIMPDYSNHWFQYLEIKTGGATVLYKAVDVNACSVERGSLSAGTYAVLMSRTIGRVRLTSVGNVAYGIAAEDGAAIVSIGNDDNGAATPTYGLFANGGVIMKNSTQPSGGTANELAQNGGVVR